MFLSDQSVLHVHDALSADETACEKLAKVAIDYAVDVLSVNTDAAPTAWQSNYLCVIEDAIIHHIDWAIESQTTVGELEQTLKRFIDQLAQIYHSSQAHLATQPETAIH